MAYPGSYVNPLASTPNSSTGMGIGGFGNPPTPDVQQPSNPGTAGGLGRVFPTHPGVPHSSLYGQGALSQATAQPAQTMQAQVMPYTSPLPSFAPQQQMPMSMNYGMPPWMQVFQRAMGSPQGALSRFAPWYMRRY